MGHRVLYMGNVRRLSIASSYCVAHSKSIRCFHDTLLLSLCNLDIKNPNTGEVVDHRRPLEIVESIETMKLTIGRGV